MFNTNHSTTSGQLITTSPPPYKPPDIVMLTPVPERPNNIINTMTNANNVSLYNIIQNNIPSEESPENMVMELDLKFSEPADIALGCLVIVMSVVALSGNSLSVTYFWERRKKSIHPLLYSLMSIIDIISSLISIPVIVTLFTSRDPVLFNSGAFCLIWTVLFYYILRISIFLVLLVSVTRTMGMTCPMHKVKENTVLLSLAVYTGFILIVDVVYLSTGLLKVGYRDQEAFCEMFEPVELKVQKYEEAKFYTILLKVELILPSVLVFISFVVSTAVLVKQMENCRKMKKNETELRYASVTVALFTAIFLICNLSCFCVQLIYFISQYRDISYIRGNVNFRHYGHLVTVFLLPLLNSALNPCLYLTRMPQYRTWSSRRSLQIKINGKRWALLSVKSQSSVA